MARPGIEPRTSDLHESGALPTALRGPVEDAFRKEITVSEYYPSRVMKAKNDLRSFLKTALVNKKKAYIKFDKLVIDGQEYKYDAHSEDIVAVLTDR